jgi:ComEC/Rec2-related protein
MILAQQVRRPLVGIALSVASGLIIQHGAGGTPLLFLCFAAFLLAGACWMVLRRQTSVLIYISCGLLAAAHSSIEKMPAASRAVLPVAEVNFHEQELIGLIEDEPSVSSADGTVSFLFRATSVQCEEVRLPTDSMLRVYLKTPAAPILFGEQWQLKGRYTGYEKPRGGAVGYLSVSGGNACKIKAAGRTLAGRCYEVRRRAAELLRLGVERFPEQTQLLHAMLLGYRQAIPPDLYQIFTRTGTLHIFAISGQHAVILAAIFIAGLKLIGISRPRWGMLLIPALFLYIFTTGLQASALRALAMAAVFFAAPFVGRRPDAASSMALAATLLLIINPNHVGDPGFLLSFIVVCGLLMVTGWTSQQLAGFRTRGWEGPLKQLSGAHPFAVLLRSIGMLMLTSVAAWIFSAPITAWFFNSLSLSALVGNLAVIPLTFMIMLTGCLALFSGVLFSPAAALFNQANLLFVDLLIWIVRRLSELPGAYQAVRAPTAWVVGLWFAGLAVFFTGPARWRKGALLMILLSALMWQTDKIFPCRDIKILRDSDSAMLLQLPENRWVLVTSADPFKLRQTTRFVQKEGVGRLHTLVVSGSKADAATVRHLQESFHPQYTRGLCDNEVFWPVGQGALRIAQER